MNDGGPAFPRNGEASWTPHAQSGMSLRDWFAGQALSSAIAVGLDDDPETQAAVNEDVARLAYELADAMIAERKRKPTS